MADIVEAPTRASGKIKSMVSAFIRMSPEDQRLFLSDLDPDEQDLLQEHVYYKMQEPKDGASDRVSPEARTAIKNYATIDDKFVDRLNSVDPENHYSLYDGELVVRPKGTDDRRYMDPPNSLIDYAVDPGELWADMKDIGQDVLAGGASAAGSLAGAVGGAALGGGNPVTSGSGAITGGIAGGGMVGAFMEYLRQKEAVDLGFQDDINWENVTASGLMEGGASLLGVGQLPVKMLKSPAWREFATVMNKRIAPMTAMRQAATDAIFWPQVPAHILDSYRNQHGFVKGQEKLLKQQLKTPEGRALGKDALAQDMVGQQLQNFRSGWGKAVHDIKDERWANLQRELADTDGVDIEQAKAVLESPIRRLQQKQALGLASDAEIEQLNELSSMWERLFTRNVNVPPQPARDVYNPAMMRFENVPGAEATSYRAEVPSPVTGPEVHKMKQEASDLGEYFNQAPVGGRAISSQSKSQLMQPRKVADELRAALEKANTRASRADTLYGDAARELTDLRKKRYIDEKWAPDAVTDETADLGLKLNRLPQDANIALGKFGGVSHNDLMNALSRAVSQGAPKDLMDHYEKVVALKEFLAPDKNIKSKWGSTSTSATLENLRLNSALYNAMKDKVGPVGTVGAYLLTSPGFLTGSTKGFKRAHNLGRKIKATRSTVGVGAVRAGTQSAKHKTGDEEE